MMKRLLLSHRWPLLGSAFCAVLAAGLGLVPFFCVYQIATLLLEAGALQADALTVPLLLATAAVIGKAILAAAASHLSHTAAYRILHAIRTQLAGKLERVPLGFFASHSAGSLKKLISDDVEQIEEAIAHAIPDVAAGLGVPLLSGLALALVDWRLALASLAMFPVLLAIYPLTTRATRPLSHDYFNALARLKSVTVQYIQGMKVIRAFMRADTAYGELKQAVDDMATVGERFATAALRPMSVLYTGLRGNVLVLLPVGSLYYLKGGIGAAEFILFLLLGMGMNASILKILFTGGSFYWRVRGAGRQIVALLAQPELAEPARGMLPHGHDLVFRDVSFSYEGRKVLDRVSFSVAAGSQTAIVGPSGAGKSTIARLAARFWDVEDGAIEIGGTDIRAIARRDLTGLISFVLQEAWLQNDTIRANILAGRPDATPAEVKDAARRAGVQTFCDDLPAGLDSPVGEGGRLLSGGQRQRVAIAQALLRATPIVILDEATAALDPDNETEVLAALAELAKGRTVIMIAHRLDTIRDASQVIYMEQGRVLARGRHAELKQACAPYAQLWRNYEDVSGWRLERGPQAQQAVPALPPEAPGPSPKAASEVLPRGMAALFLYLAGPLRGTLLYRALPLLFLESMLLGAPVMATYLTLAGILADTLTLRAALLYTAITALCLTLQALCNIRSHRLLWHIQTRAVAALQHRIARRLRDVPLGVLQSRDTGTLETLVTQHASGLNFVTAPAQALRVLVGPLISLAVLLWLDWRLALLACATLPLFALVVAWGEQVYRRVWSRLLASQEQLNGRILDYVQGMPTLRALGASGTSFTALTAALEQHRRVSLATVTRLTPVIALGWSVLDLGFCLLLAGGGLLAAAGQLSADRYLLFLVVGLVFYGPIADAFDLTAYRRLLERTMLRVGEVLALPVLPEPATPDVPASLDIRFENVSFSYGSYPALSGVDLHFPAGRIHALVGPSGSGKSTVVALLARFWDPQCGRITVGGTDLRQISPRLRSLLFAPVFQETYLFDDTIAANLRLAKPDASDAELMAAARAARCHDFIVALEQGYQTRVGEGGSLLSGGERQRIAIARAILKDAPILLLDEAAASLDPDNEHEIRQALARLCAGKTVIMIAHRPSTLRNVDQIVMLQSGKVVRVADSQQSSR